MNLHPPDTAELVDLLRFLRDWFSVAEDQALDASLSRWVGPGGYDTGALARDLDRYALLLDGTADGDGAVLFANPT